MSPPRLGGETHRERKGNKRLLEGYIKNEARSGIIAVTTGDNTADPLFSTM